MASAWERPFDALHEIRDRALMLDIGRGYLCEDRMLTKLGQEIEDLLSSLSEEAGSLERRFPGRPIREDQIQGRIEAVSELARRMRSPDPSLLEQCFVGELGREIEGRLKSLADALEDFQLRVEGPPASYTGREALTEALGSVGGGLGRFLRFAAKATGVFLAAVLVVFGWLLFSMERIGDIEQELTKTDAQVQLLEKELEGLEDEQARLLARVEFAQSTLGTRRDKVAAMEFSVELARLEKEAQAVEVERAQKVHKVKTLEEKLARLKEKGFVERLLRR